MWQNSRQPGILLENDPEMLTQLCSEHLGVTFPGSRHATLKDVSLSVQPGEFLSVVGPSGSGKSTLLRLFAGLLQPTAGRIVAKAEQRGDSTTVRFGFVFQQPTLLPWRTAEGNLRLPFELGRGHGEDPQDVSRRICEALAAVGLAASDASKRPSQLSGGMQMRLSLARGILLNPDVLLLDEPFAAVDDLLRLQLQQDVAALHDQRGMTSILVTHNLHEAIFMSDRVVVLGGSPATIIAEVSNPLPRPRTSDLRTQDEYHRNVEQLTRTVFSDLSRGLDRADSETPTASPKKRADS